jgi:radical SAM protein with 4Fe4S-binding SPASM domain
MYSALRNLRDIVWKQRPIQLTFFVTKRCNSSCPFCFSLRSSNNALDNRPELSLSEISKFSSSLGSFLWLAFSGGEIYLREDLVEISEIFYKNNKPAIILFPTNGLLSEVIQARTEKILDRCPKSTIVVKLSIDGLYDDHDELRKSPGSFKKTIETYHMLERLLGKHQNFELGVNTVFCSENENSMDAVIDFVAGLRNIKTHTISLIRGNLVNDHFKRVDYNKYLKAVKKLELNQINNKSSIYRFKGARIKAAQDIVQHRLIYRTAQDRKRCIPCYAGRLNVVIKENGDVYPCELLTESFGNIRDYEYDVGKIIRSDKAGQILNSIRNNHCYCTHECYYMTNILFNPKLYPAIAKEYLRF